MTPPSEFWAMVYLVKLHRGERCDDCKAVADKATQHYQEMLRKLEGEE